MKILFVITTLKAGGAERQLSIMANYWAEKGWEMAILTLAGEEEPPFYPLDPRINYIPMGISSPSKNHLQTIIGAIRRVIALRRQMISLNTDAVISFLSKTNVLVILATLGLKSPVIVSERIDPGFRKQMRHINVWVMIRDISYYLADAVTVQTRKAQDHFTWLKNTHVIPNIIAEVTRHTPQQDKDQKMENNLVIAAGRLTKQKGFDILIEAFAKIEARHPQWNLTIWGEGPLREALEEKIQELNMESRIALPGITPKLERKMLASDLFVLSSRYEGFPNVLCEAMACGLPVISTDCRSGPSDIITPDHDGILVGVDDREELAKVMDDLMNNPQERKRLGDNAKNIVSKYSAETVMGLWEDLIDSILKKKKTGRQT